MIQSVEKAQEESNDQLQFPRVSPVEGLSPLLGYVVERYHQRGLVGEERNIVQTFLVAQTRHLKRKYRLHCLATGHTGAGKSTTIKGVLKPLWPDVEHYTRLTGAGLDRKTETLDGRILLVEQLVGREPAELKFLMTEGELTILVAERDKDSGRIVSRVHHVPGMPVVISTLTKVEMDPEYLSRTLKMSIDETEQQTKAIIKKKLEQRSQPSNEDDFQVHGPITWLDSKCRELGPKIDQILLPFAQKLENAPPVLSMRRGIDWILNLASAAAFVKASIGLRTMIRVPVVANVQEISYLVVEPEDLSDAAYCIGEDLSDLVRGFYGKMGQVYNYLLSSISGGSTSKELAVELKIGQTTARGYLNTLVELGFATKTPVKRVFHYDAVVIKKLEFNFNLEFKESEFKEWFSKTFPGDKARIDYPDPDCIATAAPASSPCTLTLGAVSCSAPDSGTGQLTAPNPNLNPEGAGARISKDLCNKCWNRKYSSLTVVKQLGAPAGGICEDCGEPASMRIEILP